MLLVMLAGQIATGKEGVHGEGGMGPGEGATGGSGLGAIGDGDGMSVPAMGQGRAQPRMVHLLCPDEEYKAGHNCCKRILCHSVAGLDSTRDHLPLMVTLVVQEIVRPKASPERGAELGHGAGGFVKSRQ